MDSVRDCKMVSDGDSSSDEGAEELVAMIAAHKTHVDLSPDAWHMGIVCIVKDLAEMIDGHFSAFKLLRFCFCFATLILNVIFQFLLLREVWVHIVRPGVHTVQGNYREYHKSVFDVAGAVIPGAWDNLDEATQTEICHTSLSAPVFLYAIITLWVIRMVQEFRETDQLRRNISALPVLPAGIAALDMVHERPSDDDEGINEVIALNASTRFFIYVLIVIPKFLVCLVLLFLGCRWLVSTASFSDLILNALALEFILNIDELIFTALFPVTAVKEVEIVKFAYAKGKDLSNKDKEAVKTWGYARSILMLIFVLFFVGLYQNVLQQILPGYTYDITDNCVELFNKEAMLPCPADYWGALTGTHADCFPFGE